MGDQADRINEDGMRSKWEGLDEGPDARDGVRVEIERVEPETTALAPTPAAAHGLTLFGTDDPVAVIEKASRMAKALERVMRERDLIAKIPCKTHRDKTKPLGGWRQGCAMCKEHPRIEAWTFAGTMLGVFPVVVWTRDVDGGHEARVEARTLSGAVVGAAEAQCTRAEFMWKERDDYAIRSMAQTRAASKAMRLPLGFVIQLAGFDPTPAEEIPHEKWTSDKPEVRTVPEGVRGADLPGRIAATDPERAAVNQHYRGAATETISLQRAQFLAAEFGRKLPQIAKSQSERIDYARKVTGNQELASFKMLTRAEADAIQAALDALPIPGAVAPEPGAAGHGGGVATPAVTVPDQVAGAEETVASQGDLTTGARSTDPPSSAPPAPGVAAQGSATAPPRRRGKLSRGNRALEVEIREAASNAHRYEAASDKVWCGERGQLLVSEIADGDAQAILAWLRDPENHDVPF